MKSTASTLNEEIKEVDTPSFVQDENQHRYLRQHFIFTSGEIEESNDNNELNRTSSFAATFSENSEMNSIHEDLNIKEEPRKLSQLRLKSPLGRALMESIENNLMQSSRTS